MADLLHLTLVELADALHSKRASPVDLMHEVLDRVDATHEALNAVVARRDRDALLADARAAEERIQQGDARPLEGIPFGVKDLEDVAGMITTHGSKPFRDNVATGDTTEVARLKAAGAIVFGKTNTPEFGFTAITKNLVFGATRSPWDGERTPGGSSGGSAAAIAGEVLPLATASDGGGSIRIPASFVGAFGLKPSYGRVPKGPMTAWSMSALSVYGPLTKTVEDAGLFLDQVVGFDPRDPTSLPHPGKSYLDAARRPLDGKLRMAFSPDLGSAVVQSDVAAAVEDAAKAFEKLGHSVTAIDGGPPSGRAQWGLLTAHETGGKIAHLRPEHDADFGRGFLQGVNEAAKQINHRWWEELTLARAALVRWAAEIFSEYDVLLTPTVPYDPPPARGPFPSETEGRPQGEASVASFTIPFNFAYNPAATVRAGKSKAGFPVGLHVVGPQHRDDLVLRIARAFERERPWHPDWPMRAS